MISNYFKVVKRFFSLFLLLLFVFFMFLYNNPVENKVNLVAVNIANENITGGSVIEFTLKMQKGNGHDFLDISSFTKFDTQYSLKYAKNFVCEILEKDCSNYNFYYTIDSSSGIISGPSAGSAMTLTFLSTLNSKKIPKDIAITGFISSGGWIGPVGGIREKIEAAKDSGIRTIYIPKSEKIMDGEDLVLKYSDNNFKVIAVENIYELYEKVFDEKLVEFSKLKNEEPYLKQLKVISEDICSITDKLINDTMNNYNLSNDFLKNFSEEKEIYDEVINYNLKNEIDLLNSKILFENYKDNVDFSKFYLNICSLNRSLNDERLKNYCFLYDNYLKDIEFLNKEYDISKISFLNITPLKSYNNFINNYKIKKIQDFFDFYLENYNSFFKYKYMKNDFDDEYLHITRMSNIYSYYEQGIDLKERSNLFYNQTYYYASASSCFGANLDLDYYIFFLELFEDKLFNITNLKNTDNTIFFKLNNIANNIGFKLMNYEINLDMSIDNPQIDYVVNSRYQDAVRRYFKMIEKIDELNLSNYSKNISNKTYYDFYMDIDEIIYDISYAKNRFLTSKQWSNFKDLDIYNKETDRVVYDELYGACSDAYNYVKIDYEYIKSETGMDIYKTNLDNIREELEDGFYYSCIFDAITLRSLYSNLMAMSATNNQDQLFLEKENLAYYYLQKNRNEFPLLSYSYLEYAKALKETDLYSSLNYLEESIGFNNIGIYAKNIIDEAQRTSKYDDNEKSFKKTDSNNTNNFIESFKFIVVNYANIFYLIIIISLIIELLILDFSNTSVIENTSFFKSNNKNENINKNKEIKKISKDDFLRYIKGENKK